MKVLVFGHSFVNHYSRYLLQQSQSAPDPHSNHYIDFSTMMNLDKTAQLVNIIGIPGLNIQQAAHPQGILMNIAHQYDIVILNLGANDLDTQDPAIQAHTSYVRIINLLDALLTFGVKKVVFCHITQRALYNIPRYAPSPAEINTAAYGLNLAISTYSNQNSDVTFWRLKGVNTPNALADDGLHLNFNGLLNYHHAIRRSITNAAKSITHQ